MKLSDLRVRGWRAIADLERRTRRSGSAAAALDCFSTRPGTDEWLATSAQEFDRYREGIAPADGSLAVIVVSNRPDQLDNIEANLRCQSLPGFEVIYVANHGDAGAVDAASRMLDQLPTTGRTTVLSLPEHETLGTCLNAGLDATGARFVAKLDDDDRYGAEYLCDGLRAHRYAGAAIVGKHSYHVHLTKSQRSVLRFPGNEFRYTGTIAGGTLLVDRELFPDVRFESRNVGEDRALLAAAHRRRLPVFAADRFNYAQVRHDDNVWEIDENEIASAGIEMAGPDGFIR